MVTTRGVTFLSSELLEQIQGVRHGFSTRVGGVSPAPWRSLNLGFSSGDDSERIRTNWKRFLEATGLSSRPLVHLTQVHSNRAIGLPRPPPGPVHCAGEADGLFTDAGGMALSVLGADCLPVLLVGGSPARVGGAVHAGWRGVLNGAVLEAIDKMISQAGGDLPAKEFTVAIGPHIRMCCFEVGPEVVEQFQDQCELEPTEIKAGKSDRSYIDLSAVLTRLLIGRGVLPDRIEAVRHCTRCRPDLFFSYRGEGPNRGMQGAALSLEG